MAGGGCAEGEKEITILCTFQQWRGLRADFGNSNPGNPASWTTVYYQTGREMITREWIVFVLREAADKYGGELEPDQRQVICRAAADMLDADALLQSWRPIKTAPRDGTKILALDSRKCMEDEPHALAWWSDRVYEWEKPNRGVWRNSSSFTEFKPSHWQPIPAPPIMKGSHA